MATFKSSRRFQPRGRSPSRRAGMLAHQDVRPSLLRSFGASAVFGLRRARLQSHGGNRKSSATVYAPGRKAAAHNQWRGPLHIVPRMYAFRTRSRRACGQIGRQSRRRRSPLQQRFRVPRRRRGMFPQWPIVFTKESKRHDKITARQERENRLVTWRSTQGQKSRAENTRIALRARRKAPVGSTIPGAADGRASR